MQLWMSVVCLSVLHNNAFFCWICVVRQILTIATEYIATYLVGIWDRNVIAIVHAVTEDLSAVSRRVAASRGQDASCREPEDETGTADEYRQRSRRRQVRTQPAIPECRETLRKGKFGSGSKWTQHSVHFQPFLVRGLATVCPTCHHRWRSATFPDAQFHVYTSPHCYTMKPWYPMPSLSSASWHCSFYDIFFRTVACFLITCPKYVNFLLFTTVISAAFSNAFIHTYTRMLLKCHKSKNLWRQFTMCTVNVTQQPFYWILTVYGLLANKEVLTVLIPSH